jgi:undecaprenyl-phosphate galactose phosphotransferase
MNEATMVVENERVHLGIRKKAYLLTKRMFDIVVSGICLIILLPFFLIISILIKIDSKGPAIFKQKRIGKNGEPIYIYKFRSMILNAEEVLEKLMEENEDIREEYLTNKKLKDDPRLTKVGKIIRKCSIDELPQLLNILKGDMTFVGPRPYLYREVEDMLYYNNIIKMTPGLTGLWQVSGRSDISFKARCKLDNEYYRTRGIITDLRIIFKTVKVVVLKQGAK